MSARLRVESYAIAKARGIMDRREYKAADGRNLTWRIGYAVTRHGIVGVYSQEDYTYYRVVWRGREYMAHEYRGRTERGLAIMAGRFARDVTGGRIS